MLESPLEVGQSRGERGNPRQRQGKLCQLGSIQHCAGPRTSPLAPPVPGSIAQPQCGSLFVSVGGVRSLSIYSLSTDELRGEPRHRLPSELSIQGSVREVNNSVPG